MALKGSNQNMCNNLSVLTNRSIYSLEPLLVSSYIHIYTPLDGLSHLGIAGSSILFAVLYCIKRTPSCAFFLPPSPPSKVNRLKFWSRSVIALIVLCLVLPSVMPAVCLLFTLVEYFKPLDPCTKTLFKVSFLVQIHSFIHTSDKFYTGSLPGMYVTSHQILSKETNNWLRVGAPYNYPEHIVSHLVFVHKLKMIKIKPKETPQNINLYLLLCATLNSIL